jgi:uncharacterized protein
MNERAAELALRLHLRPHPEGGFYAEVHRSAATVDALDGRPRRAALTSIYFLLPAGVISRWHRVLRRGGPVSAHTSPQHTVPAGVWQAARSSGEHSLAACIVAPGFDFADFALMAADDPLRAWLTRHHPALAAY